MVNMELLNELKAAKGASLSCIAISTPEIPALKSDLVEISYHPSLSGKNGKPARFYEWRPDTGYEEIAICEPKDETDELVRRTTLLDGGDTSNFTISSNFDLDVDDGGLPNKNGNVYCPNGATLPQRVNYAIDFIQNYREETGSEITTSKREHVIVLWRNWDAAIGMNAEHVDRTLRLFEDISDPKSQLKHTQEIIVTVVLQTSGHWGDVDHQGKPIVPKELNEYVRQFDYNKPNKAERMRQISSMLNLWKVKFEAIGRIDDAQVETIADACAGMTRKSIEDILCESVALKQDIHIPMVLKQQGKIVKKEGYTLIRPKEGFESIGGLGRLKEWATITAPLFSEKAQAYGFLTPPTGLLMAGTPGCGKSAVAKAIANDWKMNILMVDATDLKGSLVGQSEGKVRKLFATAEAAAPIIVFIDEAEKLLGKQEGSLDGGAHNAVLGQFLTFMQENESGVFFIFTANNMDNFAPELVDRFDGRFFIDLPVPNEREEIFKIHLSKRGWNPDDFDIAKLVTKTEGYSGRNIEQLIKQAMKVSFYDGARPLQTNDLVEAMKSMTPTSKTKKKDIERMRKYVKNGSMTIANDTVKPKARVKAPVTDEGRVIVVDDDDDDEVIGDF